jgi:hypothetical protein
VLVVGVRVELLPLHPSIVAAGLARLALLGGAEQPGTRHHSQHKRPQEVPGVIDAIRDKILCKTLKAKAPTECAVRSDHSLNRVEGRLCRANGLLCM